MTVTAMALIESKDAAAALTLQYTASTGMRTTIDKFTSTNYSGGAQSLTVYLVPSGGSATSSNLVKIKTLSAGECYIWPEIVGHILNAGDAIYTNASAGTSINIRSSGRETT